MRYASPAALIDGASARSAGRAHGAADPARRRFSAQLAALALAPVAAGCSREPALARIDPTAPVLPFSARFTVPGAGRVQLTYRDHRNFSLSPDVGVGTTAAIDGRIYQLVRPSLATVNRPRVLWVGDLGTGAVDRTGAAATTRTPRLRASALPADAAAAWGLAVPLHDLDWPAPAERGPAADSSKASTPLTVAHVPALAQAQLVIDTRLRAAMDMSLCGDGVTRLVAAWPAALTGLGLAVLAHGTGIRLEARLGPAEVPIALPTDVPVEDFRVRRVVG